jgi:hypothetical protein
MHGEVAGVKFRRSRVQRCLESFDPTRIIIMLLRSFMAGRFSPVSQDVQQGKHIDHFWAERAVGWWLKFGGSAGSAVSPHMAKVSSQASLFAFRAQESGSAARWPLEISLYIYPRFRDENRRNG